MILSNISIHQALDKKWLIIDPEPSPRFNELGKGKCPYQTSAVDLRLSNEISYFKKDLPIQLDLRRGNFASIFGPNSVSHTISDHQPFTLEPGKLVLGKTLERVSLPLIKPEEGPCLAARVEGRSSYARCGMLVHFTAPTIHAGYSATITLELINLGSIPIILAPGAPICQLIIEQLHGYPFDNPSQFQGQIRAGGDKA